MSVPESSSEQSSLTAWDAAQHLRRVDPSECRYSRGFLRCRPEKWFPAFPTHWLPLAHSLGVEIKLLEAKPMLTAPRGLDICFTCTVDDEPFGIFLDQASLGVILEAVSPGANQQAQSVVAEYLARRLLSSLVASWSGPESSVVRFETEMDATQVINVGAVKLSIEINKLHATIWIVLGKALVEKLDGLWRRQVRSSTKLVDQTPQVRLEIAQLAVSPNSLTEYLESGTTIDLELPISDQLILRLSDKPWLPARICIVGDHFGFETVSGPVSSPTLPEGTTRVSIEIGSIDLESAQMLEISQVGSIWESEIPVGDQVRMVINGESVGRAKLCTFEGRFAIAVE